MSTVSGIKLVTSIVLIMSAYSYQRRDPSPSSAIGTVGLSRGLNGELADAGCVVFMFLMFIGRLGPLIITYFLASPRHLRVKYPNGSLSVG